jgi:uncharacterized membrane protein (DUF373 family)
MEKESKPPDDSVLTRSLVFGRPVSGATIATLETLDGWGYITAGFSFLAIGMLVFVYAWYTFLTTIGGRVLSAVLAFVHDLLLVIIILELSRTIINFLKTKIITPEPFLYICIIASTRRILTIGAQIAYTETVTDPVFQRYLLDLSANVLVIVTLVLAVYMTRKSSQPATL